MRGDTDSNRGDGADCADDTCDILQKRVFGSSDGRKSINRATVNVALLFEERNKDKEKH